MKRAFFLIAAVALLILLSSCTMKDPHVWTFRNESSYRIFVSPGFYNDWDDFWLEIGGSKSVTVSWWNAALQFSYNEAQRVSADVKEQDNLVVFRNR
jgi:hypothetical protein